MIVINIKPTDIKKLKKVASKRGGISHISFFTNMSRTTIYRALKEGNASLDTVVNLTEYLTSPLTKTVLQS